MNITQFLAAIFAEQPEVMFASVEPSGPEEMEQVCKFIEKMSWSEFYTGKRLASFLRREYKAHRLFKLRVGREYSFVLYAIPYVGKIPAKATEDEKETLRAKSAERFLARALKALGKEKGDGPNESSIENVNNVRLWWD